MTAHDDRARDEQDQALQDLVDQAQELNLYEQTAAPTARETTADELAEADSAPVDWPARFRKAADVARAEGWPSQGNLLLALAGWMTLDRAAVEAVGRELGGGS